uniref:Uncharacterized protein n=1 Tax=Ciona savignyi TaxID=51511 RepID=H2Z4S4_CIOSA
WVRTALGKFDNRAITSEIRTISHSYTHELLDLCKGTIKDGKAALARLCFSMFPSSLADDQSITESAD